MTKRMRTFSEPGRCNWATWGQHGFTRGQHGFVGVRDSLQKALEQPACQSPAVPLGQVWQAGAPEPTPNASG
jgi:hypothetical protein